MSVLVRSAVRAVEPPGPHAASRSNRGPTLSLEGAVAGGSILGVAAIVVWLWTAGASDALQAAVTSWAAPIVDLVAAFLVARAAAAAAPGRARVAWGLLAVAMVVYAAGDGLYAWISVVQGGDPFPSAADVGYVAFYPIVAAGLLLFPSPSVAKREAVRLAIDSAIVVLGGGMVVWQSLLRPLVVAPEPDPIRQLLALGYPVGDLVLLVAVATIALRRPGAIQPRSLLALVAGLGLMLVADIAYGELAIAGADNQRWVDVVYLASSVTIAVAGAIQAGASRRPVDAGSPGLSAGLLYLPYLALAAGFGVLLAEASSTDSGVLQELVLGALGLVVLILVRQEMLNRENAGLLADAARLETEARYQSLEGQASDTFLLVDATGEVAYASPSLERVIDVDRRALVGHPVTRLAHAEDARALAGLVADAAHGRPVGPLEWRVWTREGTWRQVETIPANLLDEPSIAKIVLTTRDVGERQVLRQQAAHAALRDLLTGIPNRVLFEDRAGEALGAGRRSGAGTAILVLDLDGLGRLNGSLGNAAGDLVLREVARRLTAMVGAEDTVARLAGDEFGILLRERGTPAEALAFATRVRAALLTPISHGAANLEVTACVGIATTTDAPDLEAGQLLRDAGIAMRVARQGGIDQVVVFEPSMQEAAENRFELEADLRRAITGGELILHYQPIVDLATDRLVGAEALVRWNHPTRGLLAPNVFIPLAEELGLIGELGTWVLREACHAAASWARIAPAQVPRVSVNLAAPQLADPQLPWLVQSVLAEAGASPGWLTLEVTESLLVTDTLHVLEHLHAVRALGVEISVDDFGTGYSSLSYLQRFPVNHIKIDRSFVAPLDAPHSRPGLVPAIVEIGRALGLSTIAEGIETERQLERLRGMGCTFGQGYLLGRPVPAAEMLELVRGSGPIADAA